MHVLNGWIKSWWMKCLKQKNWEIQARAQDKTYVLSFNRFVLSSKSRMLWDFHSELVLNAEKIKTEDNAPVKELTLANLSSSNQLFIQRSRISILYPFFSTLKVIMTVSKQYNLGMQYAQLKLVEAHLQGETLLSSRSVSNHAWIDAVPTSTSEDHVYALCTWRIRV